MVNSTFGILNAAATGLQAARAGMDVVGQNIANLNTEGYTRQRVTQSAMYPLKGSDILDSQFRVGAGGHDRGHAAPRGRPSRASRAGRARRWRAGRNRHDGVRGDRGVGRRTE